MNGGLVGGFIAFGLRTIFGNVGSIFLDVILIIVCGIVVSNKSLRKGLHLTKDKAQPHINAAKEAAVDKAYEVKDRFDEWNEERKERRAIYNQAKDDSFKGENSEQDLDLSKEKPSQQEPVKEPLGVKTFSEDSPSAYQKAAAAALATVGASTLSKGSVEAGSPEIGTSDIEPEIAEAVGEVSPLGESPEETAQEATYVHSDYEDPSPEYLPDADYDDESSYAYGDQSEDYEDDSNPMDYDDSDDYVSAEGGEEGRPFVANHFSSTEGTGSVGALPSTPLGTVAGASQDIADVTVSKDGEVIRRIEAPYHFPSLDILSKGPARPAAMGEEVAHNAAILEETLKSFGLTAHVVNATQGPAVTRYEIQPAPGTRVSKIVNLTDDLKMALAATDIRMEAPIPGKSAVGIEVPNKTVSAVHLRDVLDCEDFKKAVGGIPVGLGKDIAGKPVITDLAKMPHLLVAGSTGSGKSVCINTIISSILFNRKPDEVKLILIDPKMVELSVYNDIPHLMAPVVTDMKKASAVLRWAVREMESRYRTFATLGVRKLEEYNKRYSDKAMPLVLIVIDEMADLMMTAPADIEESIVRLAQKARAAGIHMILATQRPSVNVITGLIKANVPSRISFAVATQIDSRTILDVGGAEKLLGKGDMLFSPIGANKPVRIQGAFISDNEVEHLVDFVKGQGRPSYNDEVTKEEPVQEEASEDKLDPMADEYFERAVDVIMETGQASVSMLQRRFRIGYTRAARLVDMMEDMKIVGPSNGAKAREILMTPAQVKETYFSKGQSQGDTQQ
ncbi:MAG: DNA translocase FtsK [Veillonella sp.]|nr:DNA translocase FtsK [Veillonella sp.]